MCYRLYEDQFKYTGKQRCVRIDGPHHKFKIVGVYTSKHYPDETQIVYAKGGLLRMKTFTA